MPKVIIISTTQKKIDQQTFGQLLELKLKEIMLLQTPKLSISVIEKLEHLQACLYISKEYLLQLVGFIIENSEEEDLICWEEKPVVELRLQQQEVGTSLAPPAPLSTRRADPPPMGLVALGELPPILSMPVLGQQTVGGIKYTLGRLPSILAGQARKEEVIAKLKTEIDEINREERALYEKIMKEQYRELSRPENIERCEALIKMTTRIKEASSIIHESTDRAIVCHIPRFEVFLMDLQEKLPGISVEDWSEIRVILSEMVRPRTLREEYMTLREDLVILQKNPRADAAYITQKRTTEKKYKSLSTRLKRLVRLLPHHSPVDITDMPLDQIVDLYRQEQQPTSVDRHFDARRLDAIMQSINPLQVITYDELMLIETIEAEELRAKQQAENSCILELLQHMSIRTPLKFIDVAVDSLAALHAIIDDVSEASVDAAWILRELKRLDGTLFVEDAKVPQEPSGQQMDSYLAPLGEKCTEINVSIERILMQIDLWRARLARYTQLEQPIDADVASKKIRKLEVMRQVLQDELAYLLQQKQSIIEQVKKTSYSKGFAIQENGHLLQRHTKHINVLGQLRKTKKQPQVSAAVVELMVTKEHQLREDFFVGIGVEASKERRRQFSSFRHITDAEYLRLLKSAIVPGASIRHREIVGWICGKLGVDKISLSRDIEIDSEFQEIVFENVMSALSMGKMTISEFERFFLGRDPAQEQQQLVVLTGAEGSKIPILREIPRMESRAFVLDMLRAQARNAWFVRNMRQLFVLPKILISNHFTTIELNKILQLLRIEIATFDILDEQSSTKVIELIRSSAEQGVGRYFVQEEDLSRSYFLLQLERVIGRELISANAFIYPQGFVSAHQSMLDRQRQELERAQAVEETLVHEQVAASIPRSRTPEVAVIRTDSDRDATLVPTTPVKPRVPIESLKSPLRQMARDAIYKVKKLPNETDRQRFQMEAESLEASLNAESPDVPSFLKKRSVLMESVEQRFAVTVAPKTPLKKLVQGVKERASRLGEVDAQPFLARLATLTTSIEDGSCGRDVFEEINALGTSIDQQETRNAEARLAAAKKEDEERIARQKELEAALEKERIAKQEAEERSKKEEAIRVQEQARIEATLREERARREAAELAARQASIPVVDPVKTEILQLWQAQRYREAIDRCRNKTEAMELANSVRDKYMRSQCICAITQKFGI